MKLHIRMNTELFYLLEYGALIKSKSAAGAALSEQMLLRQGNNT